MKNNFKMEISAKSLNEGFLRSTIASFCISLNPTIEEVSDIKTAVSEAVTNCVVHGYEGRQEGKIEVEVTLENRQVVIVISDQGVGIDNIEEAMQPFFTTRENEERSGMGFAVMQATMDSVEVEKGDERGLRVTLRKEIL